MLSTRTDQTTMTTNVITPRKHVGVNSVEYTKQCNCYQNFLGGVYKFNKYYNNMLINCLYHYR